MLNILIFMMYNYLISCLLLSIFYKHLLMSIMSLEMMMMSLLYLFYLFMMLFNFEFLLMYYLLIIVCEGVMGLTLLTLMIQFKGMDLLNSLNLNLW
uniref:NADH dehydrogenase subunit 4L n=1 Tax=Oberthuerella sharkeyi TaxID=2943459 RepID=A0A9E8K0V3_9HYME|nr:NADH dehydrogenase subunit 4L [Oberthuerella sharkeyi]